MKFPSRTLYYIIATLFLFTTLPIAAQLPWSLEASTPKHEVRAVWITTLNGLDWPCSTDVAKQQSQLTETLDQLKAAGINTVLVQARIRATTLYPSSIEPWDACLTGTTGRSPGYDPLKLCIDECHRRGMECHAWVVTIPVGKWTSEGCKQLRRRYPKMVSHVGADGFMDPASKETADYLARICREITVGYDIDGIHLDYIRYPETWPSARNATERAKRRANITAIVRAISEAIKKEKPWVRLTCSPVGKHDDLTRYRSRGWNARTAVSQDAQQWLKDGLMDGLFPMMYFQGNNFFPFAIDWQEQSAGRPIAAGLGIYFLDPREGPWTLDQVERQMAVSRQAGLGHCFFRSRFLTDNIKGVYDLTRRFNAMPALVPPMTWAGHPQPAAPSNLRLNGNLLLWEQVMPQGQDGPYMMYNIYASEDFPVDVSNAVNLIATRRTSTSIVLPLEITTKRNIAVTTLDRYGQESLPTQLLLNAGPLYHMPVFACSDGRPVALPPKPSTLDATIVAIETLQGTPVAFRSYNGRPLDVSSLPDGMYQLRTLGRKGPGHRIGFFSIKRQRR